MKLFIGFYIILIIQRVSELILAKRNELFSRKQGAIEYDKSGYYIIVIMHTAFFLSLLAEYTFLNRSTNSYSFYLLTIFIVAQFLRYWAISSLGRSWNTKILVIPGSAAISKGPYRYLKHPNYLVVTIEIAVIPLIFSCYITSIIFSILNWLVLRRRIKIEEKALHL